VREDIKDQFVLYFIEGLFKVKFDNHKLFLGMLAKMKVLKGPGNAILDGS
jgi:hypothetical protein